MYRLYDGTEVTRADIAAAVTTGDARIIYYHQDGFTGCSLMLDSKDFDTRGSCYSVWDEAWTVIPCNIEMALIAAYYKVR